jgi:hypothetical protein
MPEIKFCQPTQIQLVTVNWHWERAVYTSSTLMQSAAASSATFKLKRIIVPMIHYHPKVWWKLNQCDSVLWYPHNLHKISSITLVPVWYDVVAIQIFYERMCNIINM